MRLRTIKIKVLFVLALLLVFIIVGTGIGWFMLNDTLGRHVPNSKELPSDRALPYTLVSLVAIDGTKLSGWYINSGMPKAAVVIIPGLEEETGGKTEPFALNLAEFLYKNRIASLLLDTRGYGESEGDKVTLGIREWQDAVAAYEYLVDLPELAGKPIGFVGDSMGASVAVAAAARSERGDFVIASVPMQNYRTAFRTWLKMEGYPAFLNPFLRSGALFYLGFDYGRYDTDTLVRKISVPILLIGAEKDEVVGTDIDTLFLYANEPKKLWKPVGSTHVLVDEMERAYHAQVLDFIYEVLAMNNR
ncbi:MAG: alpha/beta fold hydrolase [Candidatus Vogelbacteria bacterium]|nr:alpha/beta fold hydrolase [Candidatus Vogelbacteria bacterium]